jgi:predicted GNAT family acetyltransferase
MSIGEAYRRCMIATVGYANLTFPKETEMRSCYYHKLTNPPRIAVLDCCDYYGEGRIITRINVPKTHRGHGYATLVLRQCLADADREGITLYIEISPSDGLDYDQLENWYWRHGFRYHGGIYRRRPISPRKETTQCPSISQP